MASSAIQTSKEMDKPEWNDKFTFEVSLPELALLRFVVMDKNLGAKDPMGYYCIPLNCLLPGKKKYDRDWVYCVLRCPNPEGGRST